MLERLPIIGRKSHALPDLDAGRETFPILLVANSGEEHTGLSGLGVHRAIGVKNN